MNEEPAQGQKPESNRILQLRAWGFLLAAVKKASGAVFYAAGTWLARQVLVSSQI
jgi:hypothetical protein